MHGRKISINQQIYRTASMHQRTRTKHTVLEQDKKRREKKKIEVQTIGAKNKAASATRDVITTFGLYFSRQSTMGAAPR